MEKLTWQELQQKIKKHNEKFGVNYQYEDDNYLNCVIVFDKSSFVKDYDLKQRSYRFRSDEKYFIPNMIGSSIFADSLDGMDQGIRLDWFLNAWTIEYCYIEA